SGRVVGQRLDPRDGQRIEVGPGRAGHQMSLRYSKGSPQASQRYRALQAVALKAAVWVVPAEPQRGQVTAGRLSVRVSGTGPGRGAGIGCGGAMPAAASLARPAG